MSLRKPTLLAWLCFLPFLAESGRCAAVAAASQPAVDAPVPVLTQVAGCLAAARSGSDPTGAVRLEARITLLDEQRGLLVVQDASGAMGVATSLAGLPLAPGERVKLEGDRLLPYVNAFPNYPDAPSRRELLDTFEAPPTLDTYYLDRIRGWLRPTVGGLYTFWITADDEGELYLSPDASPARMRKIAENQIGNATGPRDWDRYRSQRSIPVRLEAGRAYYVEALHLQNYGRGCLAVAWQGPGMDRSVITGRFLTPWPLPDSGRPAGSTGLLRECWTNCFIGDYRALQVRDPLACVVRIQGLKLSATGAAAWPPPIVLAEDAPLTAVANLRWVELAGEVDFAGSAAGRGTLLDLRRGGSPMSVHVLDPDGLPDRLAGARVRIRGVLEQADTPRDGWLGDTLWVPDGSQVNLLPGGPQDQDNEDQVLICEIVPGNPEMCWGRRARIRGRLTGRATNGLAVIRGDDNYQAFCSLDGTQWFPLGGPVEIAMHGPLLAGLALASQYNLTQASATFDQLQGLASGWQGSDIGRPGMPGAFKLQGGVLSLRGSGRQIGKRNDQQYFVHQPLVGGAEITARIAQLIQVNTHTQTGIMIRQSLDPKAPFAAVLFAPASGPAFQYRAADGQPSSGYKVNPKNRHYTWMKLVERKSELLAEVPAGLRWDPRQELEITGTITWRQATPVLTQTSFRPTADNNPSQAATVDQPPRSISDFTALVLHPPEPWLPKNINVSNLQGTVTFCGNVHGTNAVFLQDAGGALRAGWFESGVRARFAPGQTVELTGYAQARRFPVIVEPTSLTVTGNGSLPAPEMYSAALVQTGAGQARWTEAGGVVRSAEDDGRCQVMTKEGLLTIWLNGAQPLAPRRRVDTLVRLRGVLSMDAARNAELLVPSAAFIETLQSAPPDPLAVPRFTLAQLETLKTDPASLRRLHTSGVVTCRLPDGFFLQDSTAGAFVPGAGSNAPPVGAQVEAAGFPDHAPGGLVLTTALIRESAAGTPPHPVGIYPNQPRAVRPELAGMLVKLHGTMLEQNATPGLDVWTVQSGTRIFKAVWLPVGGRRVATVPVGSRVTITGVLQWDPGGGDDLPGLAEAAPGAAARVWLADPAAVVVVERPPWWTLKRAAWGGVLFSLGLAATLVWVKVLRRRVAQKSRELHATLSRLTTETRASAVLAERDRLAGEIHDSLEQGLTAIMLQLDAAGKHIEHTAEARKFLHIARNMAEFSRAEVQHAVWDMQSSLLVNADLATALQLVARQINSGSPEVAFVVHGTPAPLSPILEHHLLRMAQEAITNACKHARAHRLQVALSYTVSEVCLTIADDGVGFNPQEVDPHGQNGHFGLQGLRARAQKIGARLEIDSQPGQGATVTVRVSPPPSADGPPASPAVT